MSRPFLALLMSTLATMSTLAASAPAGADATGEPPRYIVQFLPNPDPDPFNNPMRPWGLNEDGDVTGNFDYPYRAFVTTDASETVLLPNLPGQSFGFGDEINEVGQVAGSSGFDSIEDPEHAVRWTGGTPQDLGTLRGGDSGAYSLNDLGQVVGWSEVDPRTSETHPFFFSDETGMIDIVPQAFDGRAFDINESGQVTGVADFTAFRWRDGVYEDLGAPPGFSYSSGLAINESGQVAGSVNNVSGNDKRFARYTDGVGWELIGGPRNTAFLWGINDAGDAVGEGTSGGFDLGFVFLDGQGLFLLDQLLATTEWTVFSAKDINNSGQIVAYASSIGGRPRAGAVLLTPVSVACTIIGTDGDDVLTGTASPDVICGLDGNDMIVGRGGNDTLIGGNGDDSIKGDSGIDSLFGESGNDRIHTQDRRSGDIADGGSGTDRCVTDRGDRMLDCP